MEQVLTDCPEYQLKAQCKDGLIFLHLKVNDWKPSVYKKLLIELETLKSDCRKKNIESLWVCIPNNDKKLLKFQEMFGFEVVLKNEIRTYLVQDC